ncbi:hypothetical protein LTR97_007480 [Elasticomyces elasticus]|uniref:protein acetyllysine N-acetyltransferase n=1 Tax=Elasticomyces elasticus TaxID=574655 RepID=A0AAN7ZTD3_9PEZI|nr:hypothetical protein LTR97_007480 [Elasticomyces elasticus]
MAFSAHHDEDSVKEHFETDEQIEAKARSLATQIRKSKHFIVFTGAGISTSAGVPDFRGPNGKWTLEAQGKRLQTSSQCTLQAIPTQAHMALVKLQHEGKLKHLVSQNCDGLHRRSGIDADCISELHGNSNREFCMRCGTEYLRDFRAVASHEKTVFNHRTGRRCALCRGDLHDSIVHFTESLPQIPMERAFDAARKADLCLVLGSSLTVNPANEVPEVVGQRRGAKLVICNLQKTPLDGLASTRIWAKADDLMVRVMQHLELSIPAFVLRRRLKLQLTPKARGCQLVIIGLDVDDTPATFLQSVKVERRTAKTEPYIFELRDDLVSGVEFMIELQFMGHYGEPNLTLTHRYDVGWEDLQCSYLLSYSPQNASWTTSREAQPLSGQR